MPDKNDNDEDDGYDDDDDDYKYEYDDDGINYDVFNDVDDVVNNDDQKEEEDDDDDDDCDNNMTHQFENINSIITNNINNPSISNVPPSKTTYLHSNEWKQLLLLSNEKRDIVLHTMMEKMSNAEMFQQEIPSLMTVIQEVQNNQRFEEGKKDQEGKNVKEKNALDGIKGQDTLKVYNNSLKDGETSTSSTSKASDNDVNVDTITQPLSIDKLRQYRLRHYA